MQNDFDDIIYCPELIACIVSTQCDVSQSSPSSSMECNLRITFRDHCSCFLVLYEPGRDSLIESLILDLTCSVVILPERDSSTNETLSLIFAYHRYSLYRRFQIFPLSRSALSEMNSLIYLLSQYSYCYYEWDLLHSPANDMPNLHGEREANIVAKGFEMTGHYMRIGLKGTGTATGYLIKALGKGYTNIALQTNKLIYGDRNRERPITDADMRRAGKNKEGAEYIHAGARTLTGAALYPVRMTGQLASKLSHHDQDHSEKLNPTKKQNAVSKVFLDSLGGLGNGLASVCKGFTEAISEVGEAVGECAMNHSRAINGSEYAEHVTKQYVEAASEIGYAGYKIMNVASFGVPGIVLDAALEGSTMLACLSDYLIGPIIMQGFMNMIQLPVLVPTRYFVVLRPWSIAFYDDLLNVSSRPRKLVITAMMDTLAKLRNIENLNRPDVPAVAQESNSDDGNDDCSSQSVTDTYIIADKIDQIELCDLSTNSNELKARIVADSHQIDQFLNNENVREDKEVEEIEEISKRNDVEEDSCTSCDTVVAKSIESITAANVTSVSTTPSPRKSRFKRLLHTFRGGNSPCIEFCTVDCSTYLLYPEIESDIFLWYDELKKAATRVETIEQRGSGAENIALEKRLQMIDHDSFLSIEVIAFVFDPIGSSEGRQQRSLSCDDTDQLLLEDFLLSNSSPFTIDESLADSIDSIDSFSMSGSIESVGNDDRDFFQSRASDSATNTRVKSNKNRVSWGKWFDNLSSTMWDPVEWKRAAVKSVRIRIAPLSKKKIYVRNEVRMSSFSPLNSYGKADSLHVRGVSNSHGIEQLMATALETRMDISNDEINENSGFENYIIRGYKRNAGTVPSAVYLSAWRNEFLNLGEQMMIDKEDIPYLVFSVQGKLRVGQGTVELGRCSLSMQEVSSNSNDDEPSYHWIPVKSMTTKRNIGMIHISCQRKPICERAVSSTSI